MIQDINMDVAAIVRSDYRTADVFKKYGINFCCSGTMSLGEACTAKNLDFDLIVEDIRKATQDLCLPYNVQFDKWEVSFLIDYIVNVHHVCLKATLPALETQLITFADNHKKKYAEFGNIADVFQKLSLLLQALMQKEETILFPYIKQIESAHRKKESYGSLFLRTLRKPQDLIGKEHQSTRKMLTSLQTLTNHFTFASDVCTTYQVLFHKLKAFSADLIQHTHLENNVLFPKANELEKELLQS